MSLDLYLESDPVESECICECCGNEHKRMLKTEFFTINITHNLSNMALAAGLYDCLWEPEENGFRKASDMASRLEAGILALESNPEHFKKFNPKNGWGNYENLLESAQAVLQACIDHPEANVRTRK